jgi:hypothetical protein
MNKEQKAKELIAQFGPNAKYVVCEIVEALKITTGHLTINRLLERQELQMDFQYWKEVKEIIEKVQSTPSKSCVETCEKWQTLAKQKINLEKQVEKLEQQLIDAGVKKPAIRIDLSHNA